MDDEKRKLLTKSLSKLTTEIAASLRVPMRAPGRVRDAAEALHREEQVGTAFDLWTDLLSRRAAVLWVLKSLYVRILEDRGLVRPRRILDAEDDLFRHLAPNLGPTAYLRWVFRDLASVRGGLPELFAPQPAELATVPDALSQRLIDFWRTKNPDTGALLFRFDDEHFDSRLMGDLYQDLDPVVKKRYALLQTPDFVLDFILDETLTPAIAEWGVETVRVLDPACGSGHFLLAAFKRIVAGMRGKFSDTPARQIVEDVLGRVVGIDLNDYACALSRARLVVTALEACDETDLASAGSFHPRVFWADALEQVEDAEQTGLGEIAPDHRASMGLLTPPEVRAALRPELKKRFHVVVGNPPYILESDERKREYHKTKVGGRRRYVAASGKYSLGAPFAERMLELATASGYVGVITADSFMRREYGKALIEEVLANNDLFMVLDCSVLGPSLAGHGTPTVIFFARRGKRRAAEVLVTMGKRGHPTTRISPGNNPVWNSIMAGHRIAGYESDFVSVEAVPWQTLSRHPWSIGGGGAADLKTSLEATVPTTRLAQLVESIGFAAIASEDDAYLVSPDTARRFSLPSRVLGAGECIRQWAVLRHISIIAPYGRDWQTLEGGSFTRFMWPQRTLLRARLMFGKTHEEAGLKWWEFRHLSREKVADPLSIAFTDVATHIEFSLDESGATAFPRTAPVIKFRRGAAAADPWLVLGFLNSAVVQFWLKQVCQCKGVGGQGGGFKSEPWDQWFQFGGAKVEQVPIPRDSHTAVAAMARECTNVARARVDDTAFKSIVESAAYGSKATARALEARRTRDLVAFARLVGLQEELDWLCYKVYGIDPQGDARASVAVSPIEPGLRSFEIMLAQEDAERREAITRGEEADEAPTQWFTRHGWEPQTALDALPEAERAIVQARIDRTKASRELSLLEQPSYKRRWYKPDHEKEEREAMELWLDDRVEAWGKERLEPFTAAQAGAAFRADPGVLAVGELLTGRSDFDVDTLIEERLRLAAVPNVKHHLFKPEGLLKRTAWERTWEEQHKEDRGEPATPEVPPKYDAKDYLKKEYWALRGKLDVPKERFIAFTEVSPPVGTETLYGWAGWTSRERAKAMLRLDEQLEAAGVPVADRHGLLHGVWFLLPYVAWESPSAAGDFRADVRSLVGENGVTEAMLDEWAKRFPPPKGAMTQRTKAAASRPPKKGKRAKAKEDAEP